MSFPSILFGPGNGRGTAPGSHEPGYFSDLNLDQVVAAIVTGRQEYDLGQFFYTPLETVDAIRYRHEVFRDLRHEPVRDRVKSFASKMGSMRAHLGQTSKMYYPYQRKRWFLDAVGLYVESVKDLVLDLHEVALRSPGLLAFRDHLTRYSKSNEFAKIEGDVSTVNDLLASVKYCIEIAGGRVAVTIYDHQSDYSSQVAATFEKFNLGAVKDYRVKFNEWPEMNHVEARILDLVARLYPSTFAALDSFYARHSNYLDESVGTFDREVQFYLAYYEYIERLERSGLSFCFPRVSGESKEVHGRGTFDLALANKLLIEERKDLVRNDFRLTQRERVFVVSGPNQGGKTTFARTFGQLHYLARLGLPVPGTDAQLFLFDRMFSHFERGENLQDLRGKLEDDLLRIRTILEGATSRSVVIINEIFNSTTLDDAIFLGTKVLERIIELDLLCVCVTFVDELASLSDTIVSVASTVAPDDPAIRTYKIERRPADGLAHAMAIAEKYRLTYESLRVRIAS